MATYATISPNVINNHVLFCFGILGGHRNPRLFRHVREQVQVRGVLEKELRWVDSGEAQKINKLEQNIQLSPKLATQAGKGLAKGASPAPSAKQRGTLQSPKN